MARMLRTKFPAEMDFDIKRLGTNAGGLMIGTIETTEQATMQTLQFLLQRPELLQQAKNAATLEEPAEFDGIVWEALRFVPISPYMFRQTSTDYIIAKGTDRETVTPAATNVLALTQSAMFDAKAFFDPEEFRPGRNWYHYFTFGYGGHECLGKYVGMVMIPDRSVDCAASWAQGEGRDRVRGTHAQVVSAELDCLAAWRRGWVVNG